MTTKVCYKCKVEKETGEFSIQRSNKSGRQAYCKDCCVSIKLEYRYGITKEDYNIMFGIQNGCCAVCNTHQSLLTRPLFVDHCHKTKENRELLCTHCNTMLGQSKDSIENLQNAINYLKKHQDLN